MRLVDEAPTVVGMLSSVIGSGGSLESAVRSVAGAGPAVSSELMTGVVRDADTGGDGGIRGCLSRALASLPPEASGFTRSVGMCVAASSASDQSDADGMMSDASDTALASVAEMGESYGASVTVPCTVVFGLGMMVPLVLMTILPIIGMSGRSVLDGTAVTLVTTVAVPSAMVLVSLLIASRNPFLIRDRPLSGIHHALPLALIPLLASVHVLSGFDPENAVLFLVARPPWRPPCSWPRTVPRRS
ncbi:MAG: hypothetical protein IJ026_04470, partial [Candidatus Methanomethylophilaceae archaeon]|nr:hypothetical protein [Candidatus Methanomethylophilaceae archaeon]